LKKGERGKEKRKTKQENIKERKGKGKGKGHPSIDIKRYIIAFCELHSK